MLGTISPNFLLYFFLSLFLLNSSLVGKLESQKSQVYTLATAPVAIRSKRKEKKRKEKERKNKRKKTGLLWRLLEF